MAYALDANFDLVLHLELDPGLDLELDLETDLGQNRDLGWG